MTNRRKLIPTIIATALLALCFPILASAQGGYDPWNRDRDYRRDRRDNNRYGYDMRSLRDSIRRVRDRSDDFRAHLDSSLDRSRIDDTRREDRINDIAREFERAAVRLDDRFDNGRDLNRSTNEARRLLEIGARLDQFMARSRWSGRAQSDWAQIRQDLRVIARAYGSYGYGNHPYNRRNTIGDIFRNFPF
ncbi:MAG TPA: hypothetical protein VF553_13465 [Pyrinomonadaceae bacterium]|jgi:hypothetical protein